MREVSEDQDKKRVKALCFCTWLSLLAMAGGIVLPGASTVFTVRVNRKESRVRFSWKGKCQKMPSHFCLSS